MAEAIFDDEHIDSPPRPQSGRADVLGTLFNTKPNCGKKVREFDYHQARIDYLLLSIKALNHLKPLCAGILRDDIISFEESNRAFFRNMDMLNSSMTVTGTNTEGAPKMQKIFKTATTRMKILCKILDDPNLLSEDSDIRRLSTALHDVTTTQQNLVNESFKHLRNANTQIIVRENRFPGH